MKRFVLEEILLMSSREQAARRIKFDPKTTIIEGINDVGKSSLIKSIYWTFGAEPPAIEATWKAAQVTCVVKFSIAEKRYTLLRGDERYFALFDGTNSKLLGTYTSVTTELGPVLAKLFDFKIKLLTKSGEEISPPPAYYLLPFYVDQDEGWNQNWSSFRNLGQIPFWRKPLIEYHLGMKTNQFFELKNKIDQGKIAIDQLKFQSKSLVETLSQVRSTDAESLDAVLDVETFKSEIEELLENLGQLRVARDKFKTRLTEKLNIKNTIESQIEVVSHTLAEVLKDYQFASKHDTIDCPTCGQTYANSFAERFSIAEDEHKCTELLAELYLELIGAKKEVEKLRAEFTVSETKVSHLSEILAKKRGQLDLQQVIRNEGRRQLKDVLKEQVAALEATMSENDLAQADLQKEQKALLKELKDRRKRVLDYYVNTMRKFLNDLDVQKLPLDSYKSADCKIDISGSDRPRALLAYYYSILSVMAEFSSITFAPVIIDSPNQQDQDKDSLKKMLGFIKDHRVPGDQLILGLTDTMGTSFGGKTIQLKEKRQLLSKREYSDVFSEIKPLLDVSLLSPITE